MSKSLNSISGPTKKMFLDVTTAAALAGFSIRHFRRIIEGDKIRTMRIGRKFFILGSDFNNWKTARGGEVH